MASCGPIERFAKVVRLVAFREIPLDEYRDARCGSRDCKHVIEGRGGDYELTSQT